MRCFDCKYWVPTPKELWKMMGVVLGECKYSPPSPVWLRKKHEIEDIDKYVLWPMTADRDFCSKFDSKIPKIIEEKKPWWRTLWKTN